ncbi:hypothetical protein ACS0TY_007848 [Phlomoides rotata]
MRTAEEVSFAANGITAEGIKAVDGFLQSNIALKSLNLSGNSLGMKESSLYVTFWWIILVFRSYNLVVVHLAMSNYGGPLGAAALAKGLEGNKSLRISFFFPSFIRNYQGLLSKTYRSGDPVTGQRNYTYVDAVKPNLGGERLRFVG